MMVVPMLKYHLGPKSSYAPTKMRMLPAASSASGPQVAVRILPFDEGSSSRSLFASFFGSTSRSFGVDDAGVISGKPGSAYQIEVQMRDSSAAQGLRVVRASIAGVEINEQLVMRKGDRGPVRFIGWLDSPDGTKRLKFCFPASGEVEIQVGVFEATAVGGKDGKSNFMRAPDAASGAGFSGPAVSMQSFTLGQPVAIGVARLRADA